MEKKKLSKKIKIAIIVTVVLLFIVGAAVFGVFFLKGGTAESFDYTSKETMYEDDVSSYTESISDTYGNTICYNPQNAFIAIKKADNKTFFTPCGKIAKRDKICAVLNLTVRDNTGNSYILNSTDNSVAFKTFEIEEEKNSLTIKFSLYKDASGAKQGFSKNGFSLEIPVKFTTESGNIKVSVNCAEIKLSNGLYIEKLSLLPGLFSVKAALNGEHFVIPDGAGALIDLSAQMPENVKFDLPVYGSDITIDEFKEGAYIPCYALAEKKKTNCVIISEGEALATIKCVKHKKVGSGNLYTEFTLTPFSKAEENSVVRSGDQYDGEIALTYIFADTETNSYTTLALIARDAFIKKDYLSYDVSYDFGDLPFFVNVIGSKTSTQKPLTSFEDATEIITLLNSKGVRNVALRFSGALDGGLKGASIDSSPVLKSLGGNEELQSLVKLATDKRSSVWVDINTFSGGTALSGANGLVKASLYNDVYPYMAEKNVKSVISNSSIFGKNISSSYNLLASTENLNVTLNDASFLLFTDSNKNLNRQEMLEFTKEKVGALAVNSGLMLDKPALWLMKNASAVYALPTVTSKENAFGITTVPLLQMVFHGSVIYGSEPVNVTDGSWNAILKLIEYGSVPSFLFTYEECNNLSYGTYATLTAQYYSKMKSLKSIQGMEITSHEKLLAGVYKITYGYNKVVYVNYNDSVVTVDGILLSPQDFILV
jgi:hypothetical protein